MRLFIAIELDTATVKRLVALQDALLETQVKGRRTSPYHLHLTLHFLGETKASKVPGLKRMLSDRAASLPPFELSLSSLGHFRRRQAIVWIGGEPKVTLQTLHETLAQGLESAGHELENRRFVPHVTLFRDASWPGRVLAERPDFSVSQPVTSISLMQSEMEGGRLVHRALHRATLGTKEGSGHA